MNILLERAGEVRVVQLTQGRIRGESIGFAFIIMSAQSEADKAVNKFNSYLPDDRFLKGISSDLENDADSKAIIKYGRALVPSSMVLLFLERKIA